MKHADKLTAMPDGIPGMLDTWHLAVFTPGLALPCTLAFLAGVLIERRGWHPPVGWAVVVAAVVLFVAAGAVVALLAACVVSLWILFGWLGMRWEADRQHVESLEARIAALESARTYDAA